MQPRVKNNKGKIHKTLLYQVMFNVGSHPSSILSEIIYDILRKNMGKLMYPKIVKYQYYGQYTPSLS